MKKRVITLQEPWASLIGEGIKTIETRSWPCYKFGVLYIHASSASIVKSDIRRNRLAGLLKGSMHYGQLFAKCKIVDCVLIDAEYAKKIQKENPQCYDCGDFTPGRYAWVLSDIQPITPIKTKGKLGIWYYESSKS